MKICDCNRFLTELYFSCFSVAASQRRNSVGLAQDVFETHQGTHILQVTVPMPIQVITNNDSNIVGYRWIDSFLVPNLTNASSSSIYRWKRKITTYSNQLVK